MMKPRLVESGMAIAVAIAVWGCYAYQMSALGGVRPDQLVRVTLSRSGAASLAPTIGPNVRSLDGKILGITPYDIHLAVTQIDRLVGPEQFLPGESMTIPRASAGSITVRSFDPLRTTLAIAGILSGVVAGNAFTSKAGIFSVKGAPAAGTR